MSRARCIIWLAGAGGLVACGAVAAIAGAPNRDAVSIVLRSVPDSIFLGDSIPAYADVLDADGRPAWTDTAVVWQSSNPAVLLADQSHFPVPTPPGFSWLFAKTSGQSTVTAHTTHFNASKVVTVFGSADIAADDHRFAFALADQPSVPGPYTPDAATRFNSSGGAISVLRDSVGWYKVRFSGLARTPGQRDNVQVTAVGAAPGVHCKIRFWGNDGADLMFPVHCHRPGATGTPEDAKFTALVSGARAFDPAGPLAFAQLLNNMSFQTLDTSVTAFNSLTARISVGTIGTGGFNFSFPGMGGFTDHVTMQATAISPTPIRCRVSNYAFPNEVLQTECFDPAGAAADGRVSVLWLSRGRPGHRVGFASIANPVPASPPMDALFTYNSSGGAVTAQRLGTGQYAVKFAGLARPAGGAETVIATAFKGTTDFSCSIVSWGNTGADLTVTLQCFTAAGAPVDGRVNVLVIE